MFKRWWESVKMDYRMWKDGWKIINEKGYIGAMIWLYKDDENE